MNYECLHDQISFTILVKFYSNRSSFDLRLVALYIEGLFIVISTLKYI